MARHKHPVLLLQRRKTTQDIHISQTPLAVLFVSLRLTHFVPPNRAVDWTFKYQLLTETIDTPAACKVTEL